VWTNFGKNVDIIMEHLLTPTRVQQRRRICNKNCVIDKMMIRSLDNKYGSRGSASSVVDWIETMVLGKRTKKPPL